MLVRAILILTLMAGAAAGGEELRTTPPGSLKLQLRFDGNLKPSVGPAPASSDAKKIAFIPGPGGRPAIRLQGRGVVASWQAGELINAAHGAISFWVKAPTQKKAVLMSRAKDDLAVLRLQNPGGTKWVFRIWENPYVKPPPPKILKPPEEIDLDGGLGPEDQPEDNIELDAERPPQAVFVGQVLVQLTAVGAPAQAGVWHNTDTKNGWVHVLWTWRSVQHRLYVNGKEAGSSTMFSRMSPVGADGVFQLLGTALSIADLRVHDRTISAGEAVQLAAAKLKSRTDREYLPAGPPLRVWAEWGRLTGRSIVYVAASLSPSARIAPSARLSAPNATRVKLSCREINSAKVLKEIVLTNLPSGLGEAAVQVTQDEAAWLPGEYRWDAVGYDAKGQVLGRAASESWVAGELQGPLKQFMGSQLGRRDKKVKIIPPFTAIQVKGKTVMTVLRDHQLDRTGFFKSIKARRSDRPQGPAQEILEGAVALHIFSKAGKALAFNQGRGLGPIDNQEDSVSWAAETSSAAGHLLRVKGYMEYDGVARFDVAFAPNAAFEADRIELRIPLRDDVFRVAHSLGTGFIHRFVKIVPPGTNSGNAAYRAEHISWAYGGATKPARGPGVLFDSYFNHNDERSPNPTRFASFVHVGGYDRGLSWFCDNDRGWIHADGVPNMEICALQGKRYIRLNIAAKPTKLTKPLAFRFYLLANPFKPMPKDWRTWIIGDSRRHGGGSPFAGKTRRHWWWLWAPDMEGFRYYPGDGSMKSYAGYRDKWRQSTAINSPFINFGTPGGTGLFTDDMKVVPYTWKVHNNRPMRDAVAYWMDRNIRETGIRGVYVDEPYNEPYSYNLLAGDSAYIRDDGTRGLGWRWLEGRAYFRRLKQVFTDNGCDPALWVHTTHWRGLPYFTFIDISMDGEWPQIWVKSFDNYFHFYPSPEFQRAYESGIPYGFVGTQMYHGNCNPNHSPQVLRATRTYLAVTLPHSIVPMTPEAPQELDRINAIRLAAGIFDEGLEELPMHQRERWLPKSKGKLPKQVWLTCTRNRQRGMALLYATAPGLRDEAFEIPGGLDDLQLGKKHVHAWNGETGASLIVDGKTVVEQYKDDLSVILCRAADTPQLSRPRGVLLALSFDKGTTPDAGGGLAPLRTDKRRKPPRLTDGRHGQALQISPAAGAVSYPIVPNWRGGTIEFDLRVGSRTKVRQVRLLELREQLSVRLSYRRHQGKPGLQLDVADIIPVKGELKTVAYAGSAKTQRTASSKFMPLPAAKLDQWQRVALVWYSGQYEVFCNGELIGSLSNAAALPFQSATFPAYGVMIGDGRKPTSGTCRIALDSLTLYDWPLAAKLIKRRAHAGAAPAVRPAISGAFRVRTFGKPPGNLVCLASFPGIKDWLEVEQVNCELFTGANRKQAIAAAIGDPWQGWSLVALQPTKHFLAHLQPEDNLDLGADFDNDDDLGADAGVSEVYRLRVSLLGGVDPKTKKRVVRQSKELTVEIDLLD